MLTLQDVLLSKAAIYWTMDEALPLDLQVEMEVAGIIIEEAHISFSARKFSQGEHYNV
jgi:hypothetical protein